MCLLVFSLRNHSKYEFIFAGNRDEFYGRPTRGAQFWDEYPDLLAGKDLEAGGIWLGMTRQGKFSVITNYRDPEMRKDNPPSRGALVLDYLSEEIEPEPYLRNLDEQAGLYNGFNLLAGYTDRMYYYSNKEQDLKEVEPGIHGLSNHLLDTPWPKVVKAKERFSSIIEAEDPDVDELFDMLTDAEPAPEHLLPDTGIPGEWEKAVSSIFINTENYGTRCSTVVLAGKDGQTTFIERRYKPGTSDILEADEFEFQRSRG